MKDFTTEQMSDMVNDILENIEDVQGTKTETTLTTPTTESKFPCRLIGTVLENINKTRNAIPIRKTFQFTIEHWSNKQRFDMEMANNTDLELRKKNIVRTNTSPILFDPITKKYRLITTYEVRYNAITNSFEYVK